jgi:Ser/Thr protein kinase RdoA (MazF antagonist)
VHDTPKHLAYLEAMVAVHAQHRLHVEVSRLTAAILAGAEALPNIDQVPERIVHGDPKLNNVMFEAADGDGAERAFAMIDLDTVAPMALHLELGDAWRSWCNHSGEDANTARFDLAIFEASLRGWADARPFELTASECQALVHGVEWITLELAARFAADALAESYFGWNRSRFPAAGEHNLLRAHGQWSLHAQVLACRRERETLVRARVG